MSNVPLPDPDWILEVRQWLQDRDNAHAAAVSASDNAELRSELARTNEQWEKSHQIALAIQDERDALRERVKVLEDALQAASDAILHIRDTHWTHWTAREQQEAGDAAFAARAALGEP